ncbi:MAG: hypothetical protein ACI86H_001468 [bacterium]|jgi:hypothetical protein
MYFVMLFFTKKKQLFEKVNTLFSYKKAIDYFCEIAKENQLSIN